MPSGTSPGMSESDDIAAAMLARAANIRRMGVYIGVFEWLVWSELMQADVFLLYRECLVDLRKLYAPGLLNLPADCQIHTPIACKYTPQGLKLAVNCVGGMNHYVVGLPVYGKKLEATTAVQAGDVPSSHFRTLCAMCGFGVLETQSAGDCGIDAMSFYAGLDRTSGQFKATRARLGEFIQHKCKCPLWQAIFTCCGEFETPAKKVWMYVCTSVPRCCPQYVCQVDIYGPLQAGTRQGDGVSCGPHDPLACIG